MAAVTRQGEGGRRDDGLGSQPQRRRGAAPPQPRRRRARGRLRLQISERRPRRAGLPLHRRASAGAADLAAARLDGPCRARSPSPTIMSRRRASTASSPARRRSSASPRSKAASTRSRASTMERLLGQVDRPVRRLPRPGRGSAAPSSHASRPRGPEQRGSHISYRHPHAFELCQALIADEVIGDFRAPDVIRFGLTPLYLGFEDIWHGGRPDGAHPRQRKLARPAVSRCAAR